MYILLLGNQHLWLEWSFCYSQTTLNTLGLIHYCKSCQLVYVGRWFAYNPKPKYSETFFLPENEKKVNILDFTLTNTQLQFSNSDLNWDVTI